MDTFNPQPWRVSVEVFAELNSSLKCNDELKELAVKLSKRLNDGVKYGHVAAHLYQDWKQRVGHEAVVAHWTQYNIWFREMAKANEEFETPKIAPTTTAESDLPAV